MHDKPAAPPVPAPTGEGVKIGEPGLRPANVSHITDFYIAARSSLRQTVV